MSIKYYDNLQIDRPWAAANHRLYYLSLVLHLIWDLCKFLRLRGQGGLECGRGRRHRFIESFHLLTTLPSFISANMAGTVILTGVHGSVAIHTDEQLLKVHNDFTFIPTVWDAGEAHAN